MDNRTYQRLSKFDSSNQPNIPGISSYHRPTMPVTHDEREAERVCRMLSLVTEKLVAKNIISEQELKEMFEKV